MEQKARVRKVHPDGTATVLIIRESACSGDCHKCSGCGAAKEALLVDADNSVHARPGEMVFIRSQSGPVLKAAVVLYMVPLVLFFLAYALGEIWWGRGGICSGIGAALGIGLAVLYDRKVVRHQNTEYTITGYVTPTGTHFHEQRRESI